MTAKEKVLAVWPNAFAMQCWIGCWHIKRDRNDNNGLSKKENCVTVNSEEAAWRNAAESLPVQPEQGTPWRHLPHATVTVDKETNDKLMAMAKRRSNGYMGDDPTPEPVAPVEAKDSVCCFITCNKAATWQAWDGPQHDDYTEACDDHLGHLLSEKPEHRVWPLTTAEPKPTPSTPASEEKQYLPHRVRIALDRLTARLGIDSARDVLFVSNELMDVWDHHSIMPQPDSSSIPGQTFEQQLMDKQYKTVEYNTAWQAALELGAEDEGAFRAGFDAAWNAAKGLK